jgi:hypothetical protein
MGREVCSGRRTSEVFVFVYRVYNVSIDKTFFFFDYVKFTIP